MKKFLLVAGLIALAHLKTARSSDGPIGYFSFDEGRVTQDEVLNGVPGGPDGKIGVAVKNPGSIAAVPGGRIQGAVEIAGGAGLEFETNPDFGDFGADSFTVAGWLRANKFPDPKSKLMALVMKGRENQNAPGWTVNLRSDENTGGVELAFAGTDDGGKNVPLHEPIPGFELNQWYHFAAVVDRGTESVTLYLNGIQLGRRPLDQLGSLTTMSPLVIGWWTSKVVPFSGQLDDLGLWKRALSASDIEDIYAAGLKGTPLLP